MDSALNENQTIASRISALYEEIKNFRGQNIEEGQIQRWRGVVTDLSRQFEENECILKEASSTLKRNPYFKDNHAEQIRGFFNNTSTLILTMEMEAKALKDSLQAAGVIASRPAPQPPTSSHTLGSIATAPMISKSERQLKFVLEDLSKTIDKFLGNKIPKVFLLESAKEAKMMYRNYLGECDENCLEDLFLNVSFKLDEALDFAPEDKKTQNENLPYTLPKIDIPVFSGDYIQWNTFRELFSQLIGSASISDTQKMICLKSKLRGEAAMTIANLPANAENYPIAWNLLDNKYTNLRAQTAIHFSNIMGAPYTTENLESVKRLKEVIEENLQALKATKLSSESILQGLLSFILVRKMSNDLRLKYETSLQNSREIPIVDSLVKFLNHEFYALQAVQKSSKKDGSSKWDDHIKELANKKEIECIMGCNNRHFLFQCTKFKDLTIKEKWEKVRKNNLCSKCLKNGHSSKNCNGYNCRICNEGHSTFLHKVSNEKGAVTKSTIKQGCENSEKCILLATAVVYIQDAKGKWIKGRALLDSGSQVNLMSKSFLKKLRLKGEAIKSAAIEGVGKTRSKIEERVNIKIKSRMHMSNFETNLDVLIAQELMSKLPAEEAIIKKIPNNIELADPNFNVPKEVDILIGYELTYGDLFEGEKISLNENNLIAHKTKLGWVITGAAMINRAPYICSLASFSEPTIENQIKQFWEIEEDMEKDKKFSKEEEDCQTIFTKTTTRKVDGKFGVNLPFKGDIEQLGNSEITAKRRFLAMEKKLEKNYEVKSQYHEFMKEYIKLNQMEALATPNQLQFKCYLPHHYVLKPDSTSTKLRVVFDASAKTTTNISLNNLLHTGPRLQDDLFDILMRFRKHKFVISADIEKMFRQIWVNEEHQNFQLIYWRWKPSEALKTYRLKTVTYGTASAPYLAVKCLQTAAEDNKDKFPTASQCIQSDFYMDDLMTGCDNLTELKNMQQQIIHILNSYGFKLRKWCANHPSLLNEIPSEDREIKLDITSNKAENIKALGIAWNPAKDDISIKSYLETDYKITKRQILSDIAKLFDPLGLLSPVVVVAKLILQQIWKEKIDWDQAVTGETMRSWVHLRNQMKLLNEINLPRYALLPDAKEIELHGYSDASMRAYGAVVYVKSVDKSGNIKINLLASKSKVASLKIQTLPRLELCAAVLLVKLMEKVSKALNLKDKHIYYTDSTIVLSWLQLDPAKLQIFVSNRVNFIQVQTKGRQWRHIDTKSNPADLITRGLYPEEIINNSLWFNGPMHLANMESYRKKIVTKPLTSLPDIKKTAITAGVLVRNCSLIDSIDHKNNFEFLLNVVALLIKFKDITLKRPKKELEIQNHLYYRKEALNFILKYIQTKYFNKELSLLSGNKNLEKSSKLITLSPFLDKNGIIRVGGRLQEGNIPEEAKHPAVLPYEDTLVKILVEGKKNC
ncbi:PREDICTED: uncharacterized protein LOC108371551 isoform X2 [Rhagoletis zephyria]|uniref:uncharacterized protein LOC108371551 isoform X2 n=1 Tax=Rhagoletis zephyria TaxID=28612 RepID=UPI0008113FF3|nr:PREDICTED: uncharacterized protein LOC108371551 isoform X2 [Rhagoletis zephyria]